MRSGPGGGACSQSALQALRWRIQECAGGFLRPPRMSKLLAVGLITEAWASLAGPGATHNFWLSCLTWGRRRERAAAAARAARGRAGTPGAVGVAGSHCCPRAAITPGMGWSLTWRVEHVWGHSGVHQAAWAPSRGPADAGMRSAEPLCACSGRTHMGFDPRLRSSCGIKPCS